MPSRRRELSLCGIRPRQFLATVAVGFIFGGALVLAGAARGHGDPAVGALQVGLRAHGLYVGPIDGLFGPQTEEAVRTLERRGGLVVDGIPDARTRARLGRYGRPPLGSRVLRLGDFGWDVAELQFMLARCGTEPGAVDASYGRETQSAVHRYERRLRVVRDGVAGAATIARLRQGSGCARRAGGIAPGVTVSGARLGGLSAEWADAALRSAFAQPLRLAARDHIYLAEPDALAHARFGAALRGALAAEPGGQLRLRVRVRSARIRAFAAWLDETVCRSPVDARLVGLRALRPELSRARAGC